MEAALASVLARLSPQGEVAHEEDVGECAVLDHLERDGSRSAAPVYDYKMIDGDYLLAPVLSAWLIDDERARGRAAAFLAAPVGGPGERRDPRGAALVENLRFVLQSAAAFGRAPDTQHLIGLKPGFNVGDWRDSESGLGGGRYPYDVNAVLIPAALDAAAQLNDSGLLLPYLTPDDRTLFGGAAQLASTWRTRAPPLFDVDIPRTMALSAIESYAASQAIAPQPALAALGDGALRFHALALAASGAPIAVMHSDEGFALLFAELDAQQLERALTVLLRPFPAGLMTAAGMLVANPAFCAPALQAQFNRNAYHGTVVWSWQQALFAAGMERQLRRPRSACPSVRAQLLRAQRILWSAIDATRSLRNSELWSWSFVAGHYQVAPFGAAAADADESNAAQLWSTVYLAVRPAPADRARRYAPCRGRATPDDGARRRRRVPGTAGAAAARRGRCARRNRRELSPAARGLPICRLFPRVSGQRLCLDLQYPARHGSRAQLPRGLHGLHGGRHVPAGGGTGWTEIDFNPAAPGAGGTWLNRAALRKQRFSDYQQTLDLHDATLTTSYHYLRSRARHRPRSSPPASARPHRTWPRPSQDHAGLRRRGAAVVSADSMGRLRATLPAGEDDGPGNGAGGSRPGAVA